MENPDSLWVANGQKRVLLMMRIIAHRGASADVPENTFAAFEQAVEDRADMIELDVRLCAGGDVVVFHDEDLGRLAQIPGKVKDLSLRQLQAVDLGGQQRIPTLEQTLNVFCQRILINIEIKGSETSGPVANVVSRYMNGKKQKSPGLLVSSLSQDALRIFHRQQPGIRLGWVVCQREPDYSHFKDEVGLYSIHQHIDDVTVQWVRTVQKAGLKVFVYTVNHQADILKMESWGVDGIFTDFPDKAREWC